MIEIIIRIPGKNKDLVLTDISTDFTIEHIKELILENHEEKPAIDSQRLIHAGKLLTPLQTVSDLNLSEENKIIHLVISRTEEKKEPESDRVASSNAEPDAVNNATETPPLIPETSENPLNAAETTPEEPLVTDPNDESWITDELKTYFKTWDLSIKCYELNDNYKHLVPQLKLYKALVMANQRKIITGVSTISTNGVVNQQELPRQNVDRENAVLGAQGAVEDDGPADWLDRFYTMFRVALILMLVFNYTSTERFVTVLVVLITALLYQAGMFQLQRRQRPVNNDADRNDAERGNNEERPGIFRMLYIFVSRFITSLIPANPPPVNIN